MVGGSRSSPGGALLAGEAALRVGAGRIALAVPGSIDAQIGIAIPEAGIYALPDDAAEPLEGRLRDHLRSADAVLVGPGFDDGDETRATLVAVAETRPSSWCWMPSPSVCFPTSIARRCRPASS